MRKSEQGTLPLLQEEVFEEIMRRIVNEYFNIYFDGDRYYKILSEHFLQGWEYELEDLEPGRCADSEEEARRIDEWLKFKKVWWSLKCRPGCRPLEEMLEKTWIAYFKAWILPNQDAAMVIDWILAVPLLGRNRTRSQIAELLGCTLREQVGSEKLQEKRKSGPEKIRRSFQELIHVENDNERWENIKGKLQEVFENDYGENNKRAQILWILCKKMKSKTDRLPSAAELHEAYNNASFSVPIDLSTFKQNSYGFIDDNFEKEIKDRLKDME